MNTSKLKSAVESSGMLRKDIAAKSGISPQALKAILEGEVDPKVSNIEAVASVVGIKISYLFDEEDIQVREAGRDYVEKGKIEHHGNEYAGGSEADLRDQIAQLKSQLADKEKIIKLMEGR